jgi:hypothetical protein
VVVVVMGVAPAVTLIPFFLPSFFFRALSLLPSYLSSKSDCVVYFLLLRKKKNEQRKENAESVTEGRLNLKIKQKREQEKVT